MGQENRTGGDWVGRYGRKYAVLAACGAPLDHYVISDLSYQAHAEMGPHHTKDDSLRRWAHWLESDNPKVLWDSIIGGRREAEWDDHAEAYEQSYEGPDIWVTVVVPSGSHRVSLYFFNKDGHEGPNRYRDYLVEIKPWVSDLRLAPLEKTLARCRVRDFWIPSYEQFSLSASETTRFSIHVSKNGSFNTILPGVFIDKLAGPPTSYERFPAPPTLPTNYGPAVIEERSPSAAQAGVVTHASPRIAAAREVWAALDAAYANESIAGLQWVGRLLAYRGVAAEPEVERPRGLIENWRWTLNLWTPEDRSEWKKAMTRAWDAQKHRTTLAAIKH